MCLINKRQFILLFTYLIVVNSKFQRIPLKNSGNNYYISTNIGNLKTEMLMMLDTLIPFPLIASSKCSKCTGSTFNPEESITTKLLEKDSTFSKFYQNFTGDKYLENFRISSINSFQFSLSFLSIINITVIDSFSILGYFPLTFSNQNFTKSIGNVGLLLKDNHYYLDIDTLSNESSIKFNETLFTNFTVKAINNSMWYIETDNLTIYNSTWNNTIKSEENKTYKIAFDITSWDIRIPKKFFFSHMEDILVPGANCQLLLKGNFYCDCKENYTKIFKDFNFTFDDGSILPIRTSDYVKYYEQSNPSNDICILKIQINYENDYWVAGVNILNNFYSIFDFNNSKLLLFPYEKIAEIQKSYFLIILGLVTGMSVFILFGGHYLYKKYVIDKID